MSKKETGGPEFPELGNIGYQSEWQLENGMTLRDYFAAKAMTGCLPGSMTAIPQDEYAKWAYKMADAMLEAHKS